MHLSPTMGDQAQQVRTRVNEHANINPPGDPEAMNPRSAKAVCDQAHATVNVPIQVGGGAWRYALHQERSRHGRCSNGIRKPVLGIHATLNELRSQLQPAISDFRNHRQQPTWAWLGHGCRDSAKFQDWTGPAHSAESGSCSATCRLGPARLRQVRPSLVPTSRRDRMGSSSMVGDRCASGRWTSSDGTEEPIPTQSLSKTVWFRCSLLKFRGPAISAQTRAEVASSEQCAACVGPSAGGMGRTRGSENAASAMLGESVFFLA